MSGLLWALAVGSALMNFGTPAQIYQIDELIKQRKFKEVLELVSGEYRSLVIELIAIEIPTLKCPIYLQNDKESSWGHLTFGKDDTMKKSGCFITSMASALNSLGKKLNVKMKANQIRL